MKIVYDSVFAQADADKIKSLAVRCGVSFETARLLFCRKFDTEEKIRAFLNPSKDNFLNPFDLNGMEEAANRVFRAARNKEKVLIFGDYDVDGICAVTVLYRSLKKLGLTARCFVPEREDGYGLSVAEIEKYHAEEKIDLIITVDCGVSEAEKIEQIKKLGIDVIVTDHHEPPEILPDTITVNPKISGQKYAFTELCGAAVAYKLSRAVIGEEADEYLDFVALATVSDSMEVIGENRDIICEGLKIFNSDKLRPAFRCLLGDNDKVITAQTFSYTVAPKINAGGRMGDAACSLDLFLSDDIAVISKISDQLKAYNLERQTVFDVIYREAKGIIEAENAEKDPVITVCGKNWKAGFLGLAAARLCEDYSRPVMVFTEIDDKLKGSARSVGEINIFDLIVSAKEYLEVFGGHAQAAGLTLLKDNFAAFKQKINDSFHVAYADADLAVKVHAEWLTQSRITLSFAREIERLAPFGIGNKRPIFGVEESAVKAKPMRAGSPHFLFATCALDMLDFYGENDVCALAMPRKKTILFETNISVYRNRESLKGIVKKVVPNEELENYKPYVVKKLLVKIAENENCEISDNENLLKSLPTDRDYFALCYNELKTYRGEEFTDSASFALKIKGDDEDKIIPFIFAIEVFLELKLIGSLNNTLKINSEVKNPLTNSHVYNRILNLKATV